MNGKYDVCMGILDLLSQHHTIWSYFDYTTTSSSYENIDKTSGIPSSSSSSSSSLWDIRPSPDTYRSLGILFETLERYISYPIPRIKTLTSTSSGRRTLPPIKTKKRDNKYISTREQQQNNNIPSPTSQIDPITSYTYIKLFRQFHYDASVLNNVRMITPLLYNQLFRVMTRHIRYDYIIKNASIYPLRITSSTWYDYRIYDDIAIQYEISYGRYQRISRIHGYRQTSMLVSMLDEMKYQSIKPDAWSYYYLIQCACRDQEMSIAFRKLSYMKDDMNMLCYGMLCYVMLCYVMLCYVMLCYVMLCYVM
jgi:hypothetical protein